MKLTDSVGSSAENRFNDVVVVQTLLNQNIASLTPHAPIEIDGKCGPLTIDLIMEFQRKVVGMQNPDGRVDPGGHTYKALQANAILSESHQPAIRLTKTTLLVANPQKGLSESDFQQAANALGVDIAAVKAVAEVESRGDGFLSNNVPKVLFEGHWFSRFTNGKFDQKHPTLSHAKWTKAHYKGGEEEYLRFLSAYALDAEAAMKSSSWGRFQIMGFNFHKCDYGSVTGFVTDMHISEKYHLQAFANFLITTDLARHLRAKDWAAFARGYNGPAYSENQYDTRIGEAYSAYST